MTQLLSKDDARLRQIAEAINLAEIEQSWVSELADTLLDIMARTKAVGVAAPQIGINKRLIVFGTNYTVKTVENPIANTVLINPSFRKLSAQEELGLEGCLNCGDLRAQVPRAYKIEYQGYTLDGKLWVKQAEGLEARIVQHEVDHLNGILFFDHVKTVS
tara:strand:+ start:2974 stop:3453 length:480 start_codon:yes stop_codon:yes gene_type:complete